MRSHEVEELMTTAEYQTIRLTREGDVAEVCLNRPDVHNAFNAGMIGELTEAFHALAATEDVRTIVLRGEGRSFCAGADAVWMRESLELSQEENEEDALRMSDMFGAIDGAPQAVVCRAHGAALGGGMGLLAVCDIVVAAGNTRFGFTETRLGIIPAVITRFVVPKIGPSWARRLFLTGERFDAERAREIGLVHEVLEEEKLDQAVSELAEVVRCAGPRAVCEAKRLIADLLSADGPERRELTARRIAAVRTSPEGQEGLRAFLEKRAPGWKPERG